MKKLLNSEAAEVEYRNFSVMLSAPALCSALYSEVYANKQVQNPVVGRRLPNSASQGAFLVTCFLSFRHHRDWNVRQLPSKASILAKSLCLHNRSQNTILLVVTPAFFATLALLFNYPNQLILIISKILIIAAISTFNYRKYSATTLDCRYSPALYPGRSGD